MKKGKVLVSGLERMGTWNQTGDGKPILHVEIRESFKLYRD